MPASEHVQLGQHSLEEGREKVERSRERGMQKREKGQERSVDMGWMKKKKETSEKIGRAK